MKNNITPTTNLAVSASQLEPNYSMPITSKTLEANTSSIFIIVSLFFFITLIFLGVLLENLQSSNNSLLIIIANQDRQIIQLSAISQRQIINHQTTLQENKVLKNLLPSPHTTSTAK